MPDVFMIVHRAPIILAAARNNVPAVYTVSDFARDGGLLSYGLDLVDIFRRAATYVDRILRGAKPADLPVQFPTKFELVINLKTAKALGLDVPPIAARPRRRGDRMSAPAASWCDPAGGSPAQVRGSVRLVASVAWSLATVAAKRTQRLHGVWD